MAVQQTESHYVSSPLVSFADCLFEKGSFTCSGMQCNNLAGIDEWKVPPHVEGNSEAGDWGTRVAAAYTIMVGKHGASPSLLSLMSDEGFQKALQDKGSCEHSAASHFIHQLENYLWALGQLVSPKQIADEAEARITERHNLHAKDLANMASKKKVSSSGAN